MLVIGGRDYQEGRWNECMVGICNFTAKIHFYGSHNVTCLLYNLQQASPYFPKFAHSLDLGPR